MDRIGPEIFLVDLDLVVGEGAEKHLVALFGQLYVGLDVLLHAPQQVGGDRVAENARTLVARLHLEQQNDV